MLLLRHRRLTADAEPVRGSLCGVSLREAWYGPPDSAVGCATSLFRGAESSYLVSWGLSREPMMLVPQPTMVGWGLSIWSSGVVVTHLYCQHQQRELTLRPVALGGY